MATCGCEDGACRPMRLRLYHHHDGARIAYRETGTGPALALLHSLGLSHREWEPVVAELSSRFRVVLPDLPLHGDSEDRPRHPYTRGLARRGDRRLLSRGGGTKPLLAGHDLGAELALRAVTSGRLDPARIALMPNRLHRRDEFAGKRAAWRTACRAAALPGLDRALAHGAKLVFRPSIGRDGCRSSAIPPPATWSGTPSPTSAGNGNRARSWAKFARRWPIDPQRQLLDAYPPDRLPGPAAVGRRGSGASADRRLRGARPTAQRAAADPARHRLSDGVRRPGRRGAGAHLVLRLVQKSRNLHGGRAS